MATITKSFAMAGITRVDIVTEETEPKTYTLIETASNATAEAIISEGKNEELRVNNTIHAQNITEDITKGYEITFTLVRAVLEVLALVDGGTWDADKKKYTGPVAGRALKRTPFSLKVYVPNKKYSGLEDGYVCFIFKHCVGSPISFTIEDGEFQTYEMLLKSRPDEGEGMVEFEYLESLPQENTGGGINE